MPRNYLRASAVDAVSSVNGQALVSRGVATPDAKLQKYSQKRRFPKLMISNKGRVEVKNQFCLLDGMNIGKTVCFQYACPAENKQWTLSKEICSDVTLPPRPPTPISTPPSVISLATDPEDPPSRYLVMMSPNDSSYSWRGQTLYKLKIVGDSNQSVKVSYITFTDSIAGNTGMVSSFKNFKLLDFMTAQQGIFVDSRMPNAATEYTTFRFDDAAPLVIPKGSSKTLFLSADVKSFADGAISGSQHTFGISSPIDVIADATVTGTPSSTAKIVYRTKPTLTSSVLGATTGRKRVAVDQVDEIARMTWSANFADDLTINTVRIKFSGLAVANNTPSFDVWLVDANTNANWGVSGKQACVPAVGNQCFVTFSPARRITRGTSSNAKLWVKSTLFNNSLNTRNTSDSLSASIESSTDILWSDGTTTGISWDPSNGGLGFPIIQSTVSYE